MLSQRPPDLVRLPLCDAMPWHAWHEEGSPAAWARTGWTWDQSVFQVVPSCRARPWIVAPSAWSWPIAHRIAGLHLEHQARWSLRHREQMEAGEAEEEIASVAAIERVRAYTTMVGHRRGP